MLSPEQKQAVDNFNTARHMRNGAGAIEYRQFIEKCLKITTFIFHRTHVEAVTTATQDWEEWHQRELRENLEEALRLLKAIEAGNFDKRTS